jgi:hypothetical protein
MKWRQWRGGNDSSAGINLPAMTDAENQHYESGVFNGADDAIVSNAVFPVEAQCALKLFADLLGTLEPCYPLV